MRKQLMAHKIIAVYGNSGSYKTTTALSLARYMASKGTNIILVGADTTKPLLPIAAPLESKFAGSLGKALSSVDFDRDMILKNIYMATDHVGILSYNIRENANTYAVVSQERIDDLYMQLRQQSDTDIIVDCTSDISQSKLTAKAIITADVVIELLTCDTNGLVFGRFAGADIAVRTVYIPQVRSNDVTQQRFQAGRSRYEKRNGTYFRRNSLLP